ncbi:MAG: thermonuclease family protein [Candidatus Omnitrophica bacterium]|nr:thermonuclease family protein [Candidatus Omnitrophota bacterium]
MTPSTALAKKETQTLANYSVLLRRVRETIAAGKVRAQKAVEAEFVRTKWETGKLIHEHILLNQDRAKYGEQVIKKLSKDIGTSDRELRYLLEFARTYPIWQTSAKLNWGQIQALLAINDGDQREILATQAQKENWSVKKVRDEIRKLKAAKKITVSKMPSPKLAEIKPGTLGVYNVLEIEGKKFLDLGFCVYLEIKGKGPKITNPPMSALYTYEAEVLEVYDGDTFHALIHLGFGMYFKERLRLRRLNAPEIETAEGVQAKKVLQKALKITAPEGISKSPRAVISTSVLIKTSKTDDQYGRYRVDIWVNGQNIDQQLLNSGLFELRGDV